MEAGVERLTDPRGGAIQIYRFKLSEDFDDFRSKCLLGYRPSRSLQLLLLDLGDGVREEILYVDTGGWVELHVHGGEANAMAFEGALKTMGFHFEQTTKGLEELLKEATGEKSIAYLLDRLEGEELSDEDWEIEGHEFLRPLKLVIIGPPNTGKSTFFNWMVGANRALVSAQEGTTRDLLVARISLGGCEVDLIDTAGLDPLALKGKVGRGDDVLSQSLRLSLEAVRGADMILAFDCTGVDELLGDQERIEVTSMADVKEVLPAESEALPISVHTGLGLDELLLRLEDWVKEKRPDRVSPNWSRP